MLVGRFARKWLVRGLPNRSGASARLGPETAEEVMPTIVSKMKSQTILCGDGAKALRFFSLL